MPGVIIFDPNDDNTGFSTGDDQANAVHRDRDTGKLYIADLDTIYEWDSSASRMTATWLSGRIRLASKVNLGAVIIEAESYDSIIFKLFAEINGTDTLITTLTIEDEQPVRLPGGYLANIYWIEITTTDRVYRVAVGESIFDLAAG